MTVPMSYERATRIRVESLEVKHNAYANRVAGPIQGWIDNTDPRIGKVEVRVGAVESKTTDAIGRLDLVEPKVSGLESRTLSVEGDVTGIKASVAALVARLKEPDDSCSIVGLKNRLGAAEGKANRLEITLTAIDNRVNAIDPLRAELTQVNAENVLLKGRIQELETQKLASDQKIEAMQREFSEFMQKAAEINVELRREQTILTQQVKEYSSQMREMNARINKATEETGVLHKEVTEEFDNLRKEQTNTRIKRSSLDMKSRRKSAGFPSATDLQSVNSKAK